MWDPQRSPTQGGLALPDSKELNQDWHSTTGHHTTHTTISNNISMCGNMCMSASSMHKLFSKPATSMSVINENLIMGEAQAAAIDTQPSKKYNFRKKCNHFGGRHAQCKRGDKNKTRSAVKKKVILPSRRKIPVYAQKLPPQPPRGHMFRHERRPPNVVLPVLVGRLGCTGTFRIG